MGAARGTSVFGALGTIVMIQLCGMLDLLSSTDRTWPVTTDPPLRFGR